jgi:bacillithiol biosynthesis cysteine-adding enzyme BshC
VTSAPVLADRIRLEDGAPMGRFARALRSGQGEALRFLPAPPRDEAGWRALLGRAVRDPVPAALAGRLAERQAVLGAGAQAEANARRLAEPGTLAVVTGQQPGLFGGPLLTFHKAAGAIALARRLDALGDCNVVPVFWLASEDHDFAEANRAVVVDRGGQARSLKLAVEGDGRSIQDLPVPVAESDAVLDALRESLPGTERGARACALARRETAEDFATWSARTLLRVFGDVGLVVVEPPVLAEAMGPSLAWLLDHAETIVAAVDEAGVRLRAAGLPAPIDPHPAGATPLFCRAEPHGPRLRVALDGDDVRLREEPAALSRATLRARLLADPACGSGNVVGRVFVQNRLLPVLAYVAGPSEIAYHAQVRAAHEALDMPFPLALPRPEGTWIDPKGARDLGAFGLDLLDVLRGAVTPPDTSPPPEVEAALEAMRAHIESVPDALVALRARGGRGAAALEQAAKRLRAGWAGSTERVRKAFAADAGVGRARWERLMSWLRPTGRPQERVLSPLALVARHGLEAVRAGLLSLDPLPPVHHVLRIQEEDPRP